MGQFLRHFLADMHAQLALQDFYNPTKLAATTDSLWDPKDTAVAAIDRPVSSGQVSTAS
jgi:hypothetical protein